MDALLRSHGAGIDLLLVAAKEMTLSDCESGDRNAAKDTQKKWMSCSDGTAPVLIFHSSLPNRQLSITASLIWPYAKTNVFNTNNNKAQEQQEHTQIREGGSAWIVCIKQEDLIM